MIDPIAEGLRAVSSGSIFAFPLVFAAGAVSSVGPCVAPRLIAIAGLTSNQQRCRAIILMLAFVGGLMVTYASFGVAASLLGRLTDFSTWVYAAVAVALAVAGAALLWKDRPQQHANAGASRKCSAGGSFFLGGSFALVVSPCCTPLMAGILAYTSAAGNPVYGSALLACFAFGHALPVFAAGCGARVIGEILERHAVRQAASMLSAALMLALAGYYAVLA